MAVRGCVTLLFILLSGIVLAEDLVTSPLPAIQEFSTSEIPSGSASRTTSKHSSTAVTTDHTTTKSTTESPTTPHHNVTDSTTEPPTTTHHNITDSTTEPPTTTHHNITNSTTQPPTTTHHNITNSTTQPPTTTHHNITNSTTQPPTTTHHNITNSTTQPPTTTHHNITNSTTQPPTTTHHNITNSTTQPPTTTHHNITNSTTQPPTTTHHNITNSTTQPPTTSHHNVTNSTTEVPTTNSTTAPTPPPTTPPVPNPTVGNYSVKSDNVTVCLLAKMGLQFSFKMSENSSFQTLNLNPRANVTEVSGTCGSDGSDSSLFLKSEEITVHLVFTNVSQKFHLHALALFINLGNGNVFNVSNNNLSLWEASVGSSYMCKKEQSYNITDKLILNTFELQVQPFAVQNNKFNTAHECSMDDTSLLIPIIVGAALAGLIFIVVIAYVIGRRRTYVGYQTL